MARKEKGAQVETVPPVETVETVETVEDGAEVAEANNAALIAENEALLATLARREGESVADWSARLQTEAAAVVAKAQEAAENEFEKVLEGLEGDVIKPALQKIVDAMESAIGRGFVVRRLSGRYTNPANRTPEFKISYDVNKPRGAYSKAEDVPAS